MANVDDHGLEVLKKAAINLDPTKKRDYALQTVTRMPFAPPTNADFVESNFSGLVQTIIYKQGGSSGVVLKTVTITYTDCDFKSFTAAVS